MIDIEGFLIEIDEIPWFANVGKPSELDGQALRITSWVAWPGPRREAVADGGSTEGPPYAFAGRR
jgi:hypothetical protein